MSSAAKTLELLALFSATRPELGLSQLCRLAQRDKATTYRHLQVLEDAGFVEQNPATKLYRLGPAVLQLARTRELTVPRSAGAKSALQVLCDASGETSHVSVLSGTTLYPLLSCESRAHSTRAIVDIDTLPLHATATGHCALAFGPADLFGAATKHMTGYTAQTIQSPEALQRAIATVRQTGFGRTDRSLEDDVSSLSCPVYDQTGQLAGAVSVACVASRFTAALECRIQQELVVAAREITRNWGGAIPLDVESVWAETLSHPHALDTAP